MQATPTKPAAGESTALVTQEPGRWDCMKAFFAGFRSNAVKLYNSWEYSEIVAFLLAYVSVVAFSIMFLPTLQSKNDPYKAFVAGYFLLYPIAILGSGAALYFLCKGVNHLITSFNEKIVDIGKQSLEQKRLEEKQKRLTGGADHD